MVELFERYGVRVSRGLVLNLTNYALSYDIVLPADVTVRLSESTLVDCVSKL